jgi:hypothetical protein
LYILNRFQNIIQFETIPEIWAEQVNKIIAKISSKPNVIEKNSQNISNIDDSLNTISTVLNNNYKGAQNIN